MSEKRNYINKPFMLNLDDPQEKELYDYLRQLKGRVFKQETKAYWMKKMREERNVLDSSFTNRLAKKSVESTELLLKKLVSFADINADNVNVHNVHQLADELKQGGYEIRQEYVGAFETKYHLHHNEKLLVSARIWSEFSNEDGVYKSVVNHQLIPVTEGANGNE